MEQEIRETPAPVSEIEELPEDIQEPAVAADVPGEVNPDAPLPPTMNQFWSWAEEACAMEYYDSDQDLPSTSRRGKISRFVGNLKGTLKNTLSTLQGRGGDEEDGRPLRRRGEAAAAAGSGLSLDDVRRKIKKVFKKETWRRRRREPPRGRYGGIPVSAVLGERRENKFMLAAVKVRGKVKTPFTKLVELARKKTKKGQQEE